MNEFNPTFEVQNTGNEAFENASFGNALFHNGTQGAEIDLNTKSLPKQKTIKSLIYMTQGFQITINENPRRRKSFSTNFGAVSRSGRRNCTKIEKKLHGTTPKMKIDQ